MQAIKFLGAIALFFGALILLDIYYVENDAATAFTKSIKRYIEIQKDKACD